MKRVRISSIEASQITDEVLDVLRLRIRCAATCIFRCKPATIRFLKRMRRKYTTAEYAEKIAAIREAMPGVAITSDIIVGFPGETEEHFRSGYEFIEKMNFAELHVFPYSKRTGTPAARMHDQVVRK